MNKLGVYWSVMHRRPQDYDFFKRLQPAVFKIMDGGPNDYQWAKENLPNSLVIARDWALSEQHDDMRRDPVGTGTRHAQEWNQHAERLGFDRSNTLVLGINEPHVWDAGISEALRMYTIALCDEARKLGLRVGAMQFSVGWPANSGPDTPPDWSPFHGVEAAILRNDGALVCHEYWADNGPAENWGWWAGRALKCPWNVPIVIGECGIDMFVKDGSVQQNSRGWHGRMSPTRYAQELSEYTRRMSADPRFVGCAVFAADFANREWWSFDIEPAYQAILETPVAAPHHAQAPQVPPSAAVPDLIHPIADPALHDITQEFGVNPEDYARFGMAGHNGVDFAVPEGTPICAVADGVAIEVLEDAGGYGKYVKVAHNWGQSLYAHLSRQFVVANGSVHAGQVIGLSGNTGNSTGPHLHFGMRISPYKRGQPYDGYVDPLPYLTVDPAATAPGADQPGQPDPFLPNRSSPQTPHGPVRACYFSWFKQYGEQYAVEWHVLAALAFYESRFIPSAVSHKGAQGLMQFMPATWADMQTQVGVADPFDPEQSIQAAAYYLSQIRRYLMRFQKHGWEWVLAGYNWGMGNASTKAWESVPPETKIYVGDILHLSLALQRWEGQW